MLIDWPIYRDWEKYNRELNRAFANSQSPGERWQVSGPLALSVWETVMGLCRLFPHRRRWIYFKHQDPVHDHTILQLAREGFEVVSLSHSIFSQQEKWISHLTKETLGILYSADHPFFSTLNSCQKIVEQAQSHRIFSVKVNHFCHRQMEWEPLVSPYAVEILSLSPQYSCVRLGEKARIGSIISPFFSWPNKVVDEFVENIQRVDRGEPDKVLEFENKRVAGSAPLLPASSKDIRYFDRTLLYWEDLDGHALIHHMAEQIGSPLRKTGEETRFETTSSSRWQGVKTMDWLKEQGMSGKKIRGTVIIYHHHITNELIPVIEKAHAKVMSLQNG